jgi:hypothetical protein
LNIAKHSMYFPLLFINTWSEKEAVARMFTAFHLHGFGCSAPQRHFVILLATVWFAISPV